MVLSTTKKTASIQSIVNQNQGGGDKKAGFPYQIGRIWGVSIALHTTAPISGQCCNLTKVNTLQFTRQPNISRPIGSVGNVPYWNAF